jgi:hypothetical protein
MKKFILLPLWFICSFAFTGACILGIQKTLDKPLADTQQTLQPEPVIEAQTSLPQGEVKGLSTVAEIGDARPVIVAQFLDRYNSPMEPHDEYGKKLVEIADRYELDYRLLPAIAMQESNLCKKIPANSYNCLGFGVHSQGTLRFESYEVAFDTAAKGLKKNYIDKGLTTPEKIMTKYTPGSNGSWALSVNRWISEMEYDSQAAGKEIKTDNSLVEAENIAPPIVQ